MGSVIRKIRTSKVTDNCQMKLKYPKVHTDPNQKAFISFLINTKRFRLYNAKRIGSDTNPNSFPINQRNDVGKLMAAEVYRYLSNGGLLASYKTREVISGKMADKNFLSRALEAKLKGDYSGKYKSMLRLDYFKLL